ncbi:hypothetical protein M9H77_23888 [Catharanthus roseus]|uniref:Uncharacterized protein n=1 Tax=Catharanthus roseus TaxID=4058 RepID=A0ACC0AWA6_CATRO|nr:hypothetical protein M9H77_23888 [Catharanthus roseus]
MVVGISNQVHLLTRNNHKNYAHKIKHEEKSYHIPIDYYALDNHQDVLKPSYYQQKSQKQKDLPITPLVFTLFHDYSSHSCLDSYWLLSRLAHPLAFSKHSALKSQEDPSNFFANSNQEHQFKASTASRAAIYPRNPPNSSGQILKKAKECCLMSNGAQQAVGHSGRKADHYISCLQSRREATTLHESKGEGDSTLPRFPMLCHRIDRPSSFSFSVHLKLQRYVYTRFSSHIQRNIISIPHWSLNHSDVPFPSMEKVHRVPLYNKEVKSTCLKTP